MDEDSPIRIITGQGMDDKELAQSLLANAPDIKRFLSEEKASGNHFVAFYEGIANFHKSDFQTFSTSSAASEYVNEGNAYGGFYVSMPIEHIEKLIAANESKNEREVESPNKNSRRDRGLEM